MVSQSLNFTNSGRSISASSFSLSKYRGFADMSLFVARRLGLVAVVAIAVGACSPQSSVAQGSNQPDSQPAPVAVPAQQPSSPQPVGTLNGRVLPDFATLVEQVGGAVVNVSVVEKTQRRNRRSSAEDAEDPMQEFFRRFGMPQPQGRGYEPQPRQGEGSGFIVSADGYILTNAHVVADADEVTVRTTDRREWPAKVVGLDRRTDVAVLKIEGKQLPVVKIGDPSKLRPGEWVLAIGSPFTFDNSVTAGIVSATGRSMPGEDLVPFIQTDVAVNPGNSGGPLFNLNGEVVGINSQIYSRSGGYMGLSFAIPIDVANNVRQQLVATGKVTRGRIGVQIQEVNAQFADAFGLDRPRGALVGQVIEGGPAQRAGVQTGDVILSVNGKGVERSAQLPGVISAIKPGETANVEVWRERGTKTLAVKVEEFQEETQRVANRDVEEPAKADKLGLSVRPLGADERKSAETEGYLLVEDVTGPAAQAGVRPGDVILGVNGKPVKSIADLKSATSGGSKNIAILIEREGTPLYVPIRIS
jgi:serine protease Do